MHFPSTILFLASLALGVVADSDFIASCDDLISDFNILHATCGNDGGGSTITSIDLNHCLRNDGGTLIWALNGGFSGSCSDCGVNYAGVGTYTCLACEDSDGGTVETTINLNNGMSNQNGELCCTC